MQRPFQPLIPRTAPQHAAPPPPPALPPRQPSLLRNPAFQRVWAAGAVTAMVRWLDMLVLSLYAYQLTESVGAVALAFLVRMSPRLLFGMFVGVLADRVDRKRLWVGTLAVLAAMYAGLTALVATIEIELWELLLFIFVAGIFWSIEFPTRRAMIADVAGSGQIGRAVGLDWSTDSALRIPGPLIGAGLLEFVGAEWAYGFAAVTFAAATLIASTLPYERPAREATDEHGLRAVLSSTLAEVGAGLAYIRRRSLLMGTLLVTLAFNLLFPAYNAALPEIGEQILGVGEFQIGVIDALVGVGSFGGALVIAGWSSWSWSGRIYWIGTFWFILCVLGLAFSEQFALSAGLAMAMGLGFSAFAIMQTSLLTTQTPAAMRGRVLGVLSFAIGLGPLTGLQTGPLTEALGIRWGLVTVIAEAAALMVLSAILFPVIVRRLSPAAGDEARGAG